MIRRSFTMLTALSLAAMTPAVTAVAQTRVPSSEYPGNQDRYSADQLDNLVGPIALYPDALLAQVLVAATFPDQIEDAARFVRANGTSDIDDQSWDVSVKAVAHYPSALNMMADKSDWTTTLGRAYASQSSEVMAAVQRMRAMADHQGNLRTTPQQSVTRDDDDYVIAPAQDRVIYVPVYDPYAIYTRPILGLGYYSSFWSFGVGFPIGSWLSYDCNWRSRSVYYNGWDRQYHGYAGGWRARSMPYIHITNMYVNPRYRNVYINRDVIRHSVEYRNVDRYQGVHRDTRFGGRDVNYRDGRDQVRGGQDRNRYDNGTRGGDYRGSESRGSESRGIESRGGDNRGESNRTDARGNWNRDDNRGNSGRDQQQRDSRPANVPDQNRGGSGRDVNPNGSWGRDNGRQSTEQDQPRRDPSRDNGGQMGGQAGGQPSGQPDRPRDESRGRDRGSEVARGPWGRTEQPMVNPRRAEPQAPQGQAPQGNGGQQGGPRGGSRGGDRGGHERPKF
jgi:Protein of unknown function (DUF3300)